MTEPHYETSKITGQTYDIFSIIRILNIKQAIFYLENGLQLQDIELSKDRKTGEPIMVFYFNREESKPLFDQWCKRREQRHD